MSDDNNVSTKTQISDDELTTHDPNSMNSEMDSMDGEQEGTLEKTEEPKDKVGIKSEGTEKKLHTKSIVPTNWIAIKDGKFICGECENASAPETNTEEGTVVADLEQIKKDLTQFPTKIIYGVCPVCGMEYTFRLADDDLYLEASDLEK